MTAVLLIAIGGLTGAGFYLITSRSLSRIVLGFAMLGHATVLSLLISGGPPGAAPLVDTLEPGTSEAVSNPIPQALSLTAIVISFGLTLFLLALAQRRQDFAGDDIVEDNLEDNRVAKRTAASGTDEVAK